MKQPLFEFVLRLGDNALINGQRLSEWCGHGPFLEEDIAMANAALDLIGRARLLLTYAGEIEGNGRSEDDLAYLRNERDWRNFLLLELPKGDFGFTMARQLLVDCYNYHLYRDLLDSADETLAGIAAKAVKECEYHLRRSSDWVIRLGNGTAESNRRLQQGMDECRPYADEFFRLDEIDREMQERGIAPGLDQIETAWRGRIDKTLRQAAIGEPQSDHSPDGGRRGLHTEYMGYLLAEMQSVPRAWPGLQW
ncbi:MAG: 1,2-phenylacetyl-CoA epoxidase subunit PaaC [Gammaproteobacteria bacterium]